MSSHIFSTALLISSLPLEFIFRGVALLPLSYCEELWDDESLNMLEEASLQRLLTVLLIFISCFFLKLSRSLDMLWKSLYVFLYYSNLRTVSTMRSVEFFFWIGVLRASITWVKHSWLWPKRVLSLLTSSSSCFNLVFNCVFSSYNYLFCFSSSIITTLLLRLGWGCLIDLFSLSCYKFCLMMLTSTFLKALILVMFSSKREGYS